jgi:hypothetical protein
LYIFILKILKINLKIKNILNIKKNDADISHTVKKNDVKVLFSNYFSIENIFPHFRKIK